MSFTHADPDAPVATVSVHDVRYPIADQLIDTAVYRCRNGMRTLLLPEQQQDQLALANRLASRLLEEAPGPHHDCGPDERAFVTYWSGPPEDRLNGTQQLALSFYRDGRYASARQASEVIGADGGMTWALIGHLRATSDPDDAYRQVQKTFERLCALGQSMRDNLNASLTADHSPGAAPATPANTPPTPTQSGMA